MPQFFPNHTASTSLPGDVELATNAEAAAVTSQALAVTPGNLAAVFASPPALGSTTPAAVSGTTVRANDGTATAPGLAFNSETGTGFARAGVNIIGFMAGTVERIRFQVVANGARLSIVDISSPGIANAGIAFGATLSPDIFVTRDAAQTLAQRNGTNPQVWRLYGTVTDASNYERLSIRAVAASDFLVVPEAAGTGTLRGMQLGVSGGKLGFYGTAAVTKPAALTAADAATVDTTYGSEEAGVIANLRTRLNELESRLQSLGLLA